MNAMSHAPLIVFYDGACPLCQREIGLMRRLDQRARIEFVNVAENAPSNCPLDQAELLERFHVDDGGEFRSGAAAFAAMWRRIPLLWPLGQMARIPPILWLLERLYRGFLRIRPALQRKMRHIDGPATR